MKSCVLDTDVVIAVLDRSDAHHRAATRVIRTVTDGEVPLLMSLMNYAETLVRPAEDDKTLRAAIRAIEAMGVVLIAPTPRIAREAARLRGLNVSLADGFALATAQAQAAHVATFDRRVQRALRAAGLELAPSIT